MELTTEWLGHFFSAVDENNILRRRETSTIEFKEIFNWSDKVFKSKIVKSAAAFANNKGGIIVFGVSDKPHKIYGINNFYDVDDAEITTELGNHFTPEIQFERNNYEINGNNLGILKVFESKQKPIICCKDSIKTFESDIYYRYGARSAKIKPGDLIYLLNELRESENERWFNLIKNAAKFGISNVGLLNSKNGELIAGNNSFVLDEDLLDQIKFIDKYSVNKDGQPAVKIIGEIREFSKIIEKPTQIYDEDIYEAFLTEKFITNGVEYLRAICHFNTQYYPIFYFLSYNTLDSSSFIETINKVKANTRIKSSIKERIENDSHLHNKSKNFPFSSTPLGELRQQYFNEILDGKNVELKSEDECKAFFESIFSLKKSQIDIPYLKKEIYSIYKSFYPFKKDAINYHFRWMLTYLDSVYYGNI